MLIFIFIVLVVIIGVIVIASMGNKRPEISNTANIVQDLNNYTQQKKIRSEELYQQLKQSHRYKSLSEIENYISSKRDQDDSYWEYNRMEYKILRERERELMKNDARDLIDKLNSNELYKIPYEELKGYYHVIVRSQHIYADVDISKIESILESLAFEKFMPLLKQQPPSAAVRWLRARKNQGEYIPANMFQMAEKIHEEEKYSQKRKNILTALNKAKKANDLVKIAEFEQYLQQLETKPPPSVS